MRKHIGLAVGIALAGAVAFAGILTGSRKELRGPGAGHQEEVEHVGGTSSTEMRVAEAHDRTVGVVISGAPVPAVVVGIRAQLHHSKRYCGSRIRMAVAASADRDLHMFREVLGTRRRRWSWSFGVAIVQAEKLHKGE